MKGKFIGLGTLFGGLTLFIWGFVWHAANPLYENALHTFSDPQSANQSIKTLCPDNGMYMTEEGALVIAAFKPDMSSKADDMGGALIIEIITNFLFALLLATIVGCVGIMGSPLKGALFLGFVGLTAQVGTEVSYWNWYGFDGLFVTLNIVGESLAWFLTGIVICALYAKFHKPSA